MFMKMMARDRLSPSAKPTDAEPSGGEQSGKKNWSVHRIDMDRDIASPEAELGDTSKLTGLVLDRKGVANLQLTIERLFTAAN
jgi:hypothetical protein